jgi:hypothetical protein
MPNPSAPDPFLRRLFWVAALAVLIILVLKLLPWAEHYLIRITAEPRTVTPRGGSTFRYVTLQ